MVILLFFIVLSAGAWMWLREQRRQEALIRNNKGVELMLEERLDEARQAFEECLDLDPSFLEAITNLAYLERKEGNVTEALKLYREAVRLSPGKALHHFNLGQFLLDRDSLDEAVESLRRAVDLDPSYAEAYNELGRAYMKFERWDAAQRELENGLAVHGVIPPNTRGTLHKNLAKALLGQSAFREAISHLKEALTLLDPGNHDALRECRFLMAQANAQLGEGDEACRQLEAFEAMAGRYSSLGPAATELGARQGCPIGSAEN